MEFLSEYGLFLIKTATIVAAILVVMATAFANTMKQKKEGKGEITVTHLNKDVENYRDELKHVVEDAQTLKAEAKAEKKKKKLEKKEEKKEKKARKKDNSEEAELKKRIYVLDFDGDPKASQVEDLRQAITAVLTMIRPDSDEILLRLESPGGMVHAYGLAASQLHRIRSKDIPLTICVDKVAASGGYMMACVATNLIAAPFAYIGSIGVLVQIPNFNKLLKKKNVDFEMVTAGEHKRTLTMFGENTAKGREKMLEDVTEVHELFKGFIRDSRPGMDIDKLATGETWLGSRAHELGLVDEVATSDEIITNACDTADVYHVAFEKKKGITDKLGSLMENTLDNTLMRWLQRSGSKDEFIS
ncbi:MAG: protease SohB [Gammaproteobacteria bacterium]|nr:protease SohB [Gammaproteobacteria bacterium]